MSIDLLKERRERGERLVSLAGDRGYRELHPEDAQSIAMDAVSDILTTLFGPAGGCLPIEGLAKIVYDDEAIRNASAFLGAALRSYEGDAEDYESGNPGVAP